MKTLDISHGCGNLRLSSGLGVPLTLERVDGPQLEGFDPLNDSQTQFDYEPIGGSTVGPQYPVTPKTKGLLAVCCDGQGWRNPGNGLLIDAANTAYVPVIENKPYLAIRYSSSKGMAVCLEV